MRDYTVFHNCDKCEVYKHISKLGEFSKRIKIREVIINKTIWLCESCMTLGKIKYEVVANYVCVTSPKVKGV